MKDNWKTQYCYDIKYLQADLQIHCNPNEKILVGFSGRKPILKFIWKKNKIYMEKQRNENIQNNFEKEERWKILPDFRT